MESQSLKAQFLEILKKQSLLLDEILEEQGKIHEFVCKRHWLELEASLKKMQVLTDGFSELDGLREGFEGRLNPYSDSQLASALREVKSRLLKSKIQTEVLKEHIRVTQRFLKGIFENALPERRNLTYSRYGKIVNSGLQNVVVDRTV